MGHQKALAIMNKEKNSLWLGFYIRHLRYARSDTELKDLVDEGGSSPCTATCSIGSPLVSRAAVMTLNSWMPFKWLESIHSHLISIGGPLVSRAAVTVLNPWKLFKWQESIHSHLLSIGGPLVSRAAVKALNPAIQMAISPIGINRLSKMQFETRRDCIVGRWWPNYTSWWAVLVRHSNPQATIYFLKRLNQDIWLIPPGKCRRQSASTSHSPFLNNLSKPLLMHRSHG
jgi:hypothetical protein